MHLSSAELEPECYVLITSSPKDIWYQGHVELLSWPSTTPQVSRVLAKYEEGHSWETGLDRTSESSPLKETRQSWTKWVVVVFFFFVVGLCPDIKRMASLEMLQGKAKKKQRIIALNFSNLFNTSSPGLNQLLLEKLHSTEQSWLTPGTNLAVKIFVS